jgi:tetratricopeptide (TPR) repeat protein
MLGLAYARGGRAAEAIALLEEGAERARFSSLRVEPHRLVGLAIGYMMVGRFEDAVRTVERGLELSRTYRSSFAEAWGVQTLATIVLRQDPPDPVRAVAYGSEALARSLPMGTRPLSAHCHLVLSRAYRRAGDSARCDEHLTRAVAMYEEMEMPNWLEASDRPSTIIHA